jgi:hypothetical protein
LERVWLTLTDTGPFQIGSGIRRDNWLNVAYVVM